MKLSGLRKVLLFSIIALILAAQPGLGSEVDTKLSAARKVMLDDLEKERQFNFYMDQGLSAYINEQNYEFAVRNFEAALAIKPKDINARKAKRLALEKSKIKSSIAKIPISSTFPVKGMLVPTQIVSPAILISPLQKIRMNQDRERTAIEKEKRIKKYYQAGVQDYMRENYSRAARKMKKILKLDSANAKAKKLLIKIHAFKN